MRSPRRAPSRSTSPSTPHVAVDGLGREDAEVQPPPGAARTRGDRAGAGGRATRAATSAGGRKSRSGGSGAGPVPRPPPGGAADLVPGVLPLAGDVGAVELDEHGVAGEVVQQRAALPGGRLGRVRAGAKRTSTGQDAQRLRPRPRRAGESTSKWRIDSTSSPQNSTRAGSGEPKPKTSRMPPRSANCPTSSTVPTRSKPISSSRCVDLRGPDLLADAQLELQRLEPVDGRRELLQRARGGHQDGHPPARAAPPAPPPAARRSPRASPPPRRAAPRAAGRATRCPRPAAPPGRRARSRPPPGWAPPSPTPAPGARGAAPPPAAPARRPAGCRSPPPRPRAAAPPPARRSPAASGRPRSGGNAAPAGS